MVDPCLRYKPLFNQSKHRSCLQVSFLNDVEECDELISRDISNTITAEFGLYCKRNEWKRTLVGTLSSLGGMIGTPIAGIISDRVGRKLLILWSIVLTAVFGILRSLSLTYVQYIICEFLSSFFHSGLFNTFYITAVEVVGPDYRGLGGTIICIYYAIGEMMFAFIYLLFDSWRLNLMVIYVPLLLLAIPYYWIFPESIRWLIAKKKKTEVIKVIDNIAYWNNKSLSDEIKKTVEYMCSYEQDNISRLEKECLSPFKEVLKSRRLLLIVLDCAFCSATVIFVYYGLSQYSILISGEKSWNFILVSFVEIPGILLSNIMIDKCGRKSTLFTGLAITGVALFAMYFNRGGSHTIYLILYIIGKMAISGCYAAFYILSSEIFPTDLRNSLVGFSSAAGQVGSLVAPQVPVLENYIDSILLFSGLSFATGLLVLYFPETRNRPMATSVNDAIRPFSKKKNYQGKILKSQVVDDDDPSIPLLGRNAYF